MHRHALVRFLEAWARRRPNTTHYRDLLMCHEAPLRRNPPMELQVKNPARMSEAQKQAVLEREQALRHGEVGRRQGGGAAYRPGPCEGSVLATPWRA
ncbi:hypothetical protein [uncultured Piscinibacter sp.]|uniref:hypothetical protein n=1 Tax=uncultured Piscinibacter sp. TaxID=1131835 RepID=UPI0026128FA8|nr:hypothetical protein [uncultured Piscinibacter sp.]